MLTNEHLKYLRWENKCADGCYHPYDHSHSFTLGKETQKACPGCNLQMAIDAQIFGHELGRNRICLSNKYKCACGKEVNDILYDGPPKGFEELYKIAEAKLLAQHKT